MQSELQRMARGREADPDARNRGRLAALRAEETVLNAQLAEEQRRFTTPQRMREVLEEMLERNKRLRLVDLKTIPGLDQITVEADGSLRIGALVTLAKVVAHEGLRKTHPALARACGEAASPLVHEGIAERDPNSRAIEPLPEWRTPERKDRSREERMCIGTVDAFQGKEFDIVFLSVTRSNTIPAGTDDDYRRKFGHLVVANRLCVAMSRQRQLLVAVGDQAMFRTDAARAAVPGLTRFLELCGGEDGLVV